MVRVYKIIDCSCKSKLERFFLVHVKQKLGDTWSLVEYKNIKPCGRIGTPEKCVINLSKTSVMRIYIIKHYKLSLYFVILPFKSVRSMLTVHHQHV